VSVRAVGAYMCIQKQEKWRGEGLLLIIMFTLNMDRHSPPATVLMNFLKMAGSLSPLKLRVSPLGEGERE